MEFIAQHGKWFCVKKLQIKGDTPPIDIFRVLVSIRESTGRKVDEYLHRAGFDKAKLDEVVEEIAPAKRGRYTNEEVNRILMRLRGPSVAKKLGDISPVKEGRELARVYIAKQVLNRVGIRVDYDLKTVDKYLEEMEKLEYAK